MRFVLVLSVYTASPNFLNRFEESCFFSFSIGSRLTSFDRSNVYPSTIAPAMLVGPSVPSVPIDAMVMFLLPAIFRAALSANS